MTYRPHSRVLPTSICAAVALSATTACSGIGPDDDLEFRTSDMPAAEAMPAPLDSIPLPNPNPDPDPDPEPEPMSADKMVGLTMEELVQQNAWFVTYQMDPLPSAPANLDPIIAQPDRGWPAHALQWKHEATQALTGATFDLAAAATAIGGVLGLGYGVAAPNTGPLNAMEAGGVVFHSSPNPSSDPPGDWLSERLTDP
nr:hypothetical protein [Deltaproteobacteria bacterium]